MANRMIKDSIRTSKSVNMMSDFQFRLWVYLITYVDDYGRGSADPEILKGFVFPRRKGVTEATIEKALADLANSGSVILYEVDGEPYFCFPNWGDHQRIQTKKSKYPAPDDGKPRKSTVSHGESPPETKPKPNTNSNTKENNSAPAGAFTPPTLEEVEAYCRERGNFVNAQRFIDFYTSKGWMVGKTKMKDWKASVRTWEQEDKKQPAIKNGMKCSYPDNSDLKFMLKELKVEDDLESAELMYLGGGV